MAAARRDVFRWGDAEEEEDEGGLESVLPPPQVIGPDEKGIKIVIEWRVNEDGQRLKVTRKIRVRKQLKKLKPEVIRRRGMDKFGDARGQLGSDNFTMVSTEEIFLERPGLPGAKAEEAKPMGELAALGSASLMVCRICGKKGDHWTSKCPFKELAASKGLTVGEKFEEDGSSLPTAGAGGGKSSYVPPSRRAGGAATMEGESQGGGGGRGGRGGQRDENSIRVTNLSEDTREADLQELFSPFGPISRIYVAMDRDTGLSRGFAFINFVNREDAVRAINKLNKYGYDNLILTVEWAAPRPERA